MNPWDLIPENIATALKGIPTLQLLDNTRWRHRLEQHPFPSINLTSWEIRETVITAQLRNVTPPLCWVDAGTGRAFLGAFPMTGFDITHPSGEPLVEHQEWLLERLKEMQDIALGERRSREWEVLIVVPLLDKDSREWDHGDYSGWNKLACYGAYSSSGGVAPIPLRSWAESACAPR